MCGMGVLGLSLVGADRVDNSLHNELAAIQPPLDTVMLSYTQIINFRQVFIAFHTRIVTIS